MAFAFDTLQAVEIDLLLNQEINGTILPIVKKSLGKHLASLDLSGAQIFNMESVLKYVRLTKSLKALDLSNTNLGERQITKLTRALMGREIHLSKLDLSRNPAVDDEMCAILAKLFSQRSSIKHLHLDETGITEAGVQTMVESIAENLKVHTLSFKKCNVQIFDQATQPQWQRISGVMGQNCSLTLLELEGNPKIDEDFVRVIEAEIKKNQQIVEKIFPKLLEQEEKAAEKRRER